MNKPVVISYRQYLKGNIHNVLLMTMLWVNYIQFSVGAMAWYYLSDKPLPQLIIVISLHLYIYH